MYLKLPEILSGILKYSNKNVVSKYRYIKNEYRCVQVE